MRIPPQLSPHKLCMRWHIRSDQTLFSGAANTLPATPPGRKLLTHQLAHTIQQSHSSSVRDHGSASRGASVQLHNEGCSLQRFASEEHVKIGDIAEPGQIIQYFWLWSRTIG